MSRICYYISLGLWIGGLIIYGILYVQGIELTQLWPYPCAVFTLFGVYCPGCGGTRAVESFLEGHILQSLLYHPLVPYTAILTLCFIVSHTLNICTKGRVKAMQFRPIYLYSMLIILIIQCIGKNILMICSAGGENVFL